MRPQINGAGAKLFERCGPAPQLNWEETEMRKGMKSALCFALIVGLTTASMPQQNTGTPLTNQSHSTPAPKEASGKPRTTNAVVYTNNRYGFRFRLPASWKGYSIVRTEWSGSSGSEANLEEHFPLIVIRHPLYTEDNPREDIPIMVFTHKQWREVDRGDISVSAAPFGPGEIGRNSKYVFALPPRFDYDFAEGWEEVIKVLDGKPLHAFDSANSSSPHPPRTGLK
jgi:hypothetical protein